jgi:hypothetical protein
MASLWNFVARLTRRRRQEPQRSLPTANVEQQGAETPPASELVPDDAASVTEPRLAGAIASEWGNAIAAGDIGVGPAAATTTDTASPAVSGRDDGVAAEPDTQRSSPAPRGLAPSRQKRKDGEAVAGRQLGYSVTITPQAISLDDEIKLLRSKLIDKLRVQNVQLKAMLERFER